MPMARREFEGRVEGGGGGGGLGLRVPGTEGVLAIDYDVLRGIEGEDDVGALYLCMFILFCILYCELTTLPCTCSVHQVQTLRERRTEIGESELAAVDFGAGTCASSATLPLASLIGDRYQQHYLAVIDHGEDFIGVGAYYYHHHY